MGKRVGEACSYPPNTKKIQDEDFLNPAATPRLSVRSSRQAGLEVETKVEHWKKSGYMSEMPTHEELKQYRRFEKSDFMGAATYCKSHDDIF